MASPVTLRLDRNTRQRITRAADRERVSASEVIREAIQAWLDKHESTASPYEAVVDLIGVAHGGNPERSSMTGHRFTELLRRRQRDS